MSFKVDYKLEDIKRLLNKKHLLIIGKTDTDRRNCINKVIETTDFTVFRFPKKMKTIYDYLAFVKQEKLYNPWHESKGSYNTNQILDFHYDWISENSNSLIIMEEFDSMEDAWKIELVKKFVDILENRKKGDKNIHLIISQNNENNLIEELSQKIYIKEKERRTKRQIIEQHLEFIDL